MRADSFHWLSSFFPLFPSPPLPHPSCSVWDLALERDAEEEADFEQSQDQPQAEAPADLPPQLLFVHQV